MSDSDNLQDKFDLKNAKYKTEQDCIFRTIKKKINYDDDTNTFIVDDIDREYVINTIYPKIKKYFHFDVYGRIDMANENSHISLIKKIFISRGFTLLLKNVTVKNDGEKKKVKKYYVT